MTKKILIIGAGITGVTTAYSLYKRGYDVTVVEAERYAAMMTSYANGGQLSVSNSEVWTTWSNVKKGFKWMLQKDAPLLFRPYPSIPKIKWIAGFMANTVTGRYESNTLKTIELGLQSREAYSDIMRGTGIDFDHSDTGILHIYRDPTYFDSAKRACKLYEQAGVHREILDREGVFDTEPALRQDHTIIGGTYTASDGMGDIHKFTTNLARWLGDRGVKFRYHASVKDAKRLPGKWSVRIESEYITDWYEYSDVVICAGSRAAAVGRLFGESIPVYPVKGYSITLQVKDPSVLPVTSLLDDAAKIVTSTLGDRLRVAGTAELDDWNLDIRRDRIDPLVRWTEKNLPGVSTEDCRPWAGLRPMTPSMMPLVKQGQRDGVWLNTGHGHLGWTLGAGTAEIIAHEITGK